MSGRPTCSIDSCDRPVVGRRLCRAHYQRAWKAGEFTNQPLPTREPGPTICPPDHKHDASTTCYIQHQCRCAPCRAHRAKRERTRNRQKAYGTFDTGLVDAGPVRDHMMALAEFGIGYKRAAELAGIGITAARNLIWGRQDAGPRYGELQKRISRYTAQRLLAIKPTVDNLSPGATVTVLGTRRRLQALIAIGWSQSKLAARLGMTRTNFGHMLHYNDRVTAATHRAVCALFDELWDQTPPHTEHRDLIAYNRTIGYAKARRWLPPLAWDDPDTDIEPPAPDELVDVDEIAVDLACAGEHVRLTVNERREAVRRLHATRLSDPTIAQRLGITDRTVLRIRTELGLPAFDYADLQKAVHAA